MSKAVFLDRDGTLLDEPPNEVVDSWGKFKIKEGICYLSQLSSIGFCFFIVTNQEAIGEGKLEENFYKKTNKKLLERLREENVFVEKIYTCPHAAVEKCSCAKPQTEFARRASKEFNLSLEQSWMIGDRIEDINFAQNSGMKSILLKSRFHNKTENFRDTILAEDLHKAIDTILYLFSNP